MVTSALVPTSGVDVLTSLSGENLAVVLVTLCNYSVSACTVDMYVIPTAGITEVKNKIVHQRNLRPGDSLFLDQAKHLLSNGDKIRIVASINAAISVGVSYITI